MAIAVSHTFVTGIADDGTPVGGVQPSHWNAAHTVTGAQAALAPTAVKTGAYNAVVNDLVPVDTTSGSVTITLPTAPADGSHICVKQVTRGGTNTVSVVTGGSDVFNKAGGVTTATLTLSGAAQTYQYKATGAIWYVVADDMPYASLLANAQSWAGQQTFASPILGTPASGTLTNCTGLPIAGIASLGTGVGTALAVNVGSAGAFVTFNGALGTPSSGTLTSCTGLPAAGVVGTAAVLGGNAFTGSNSTTLSIAATSTDGQVLTNTTAAAAGAQQWSPRLHFTGQGWKTTATAASQACDFVAELQPVQGSANPTANLVISSQINGAGYTGQLTLGSGGRLTVTEYISQSDGVWINTSTANYTFCNSSFQAYVKFIAGDIAVRSGAKIGWVNSATDANNTIDAMFTKSAAAAIQQGAANAASPVAQILQAQGSRSGTDTNIGGANYTHSSGIGTGTGTLSSLLLASPIAVASGTGAQTMTTGLTIKAGAAVLTSYIVANLPAAATAGAGATAFVTDASTTLILGLGGTVAGSGANKVPVYSDGTNWLYG